MNKLKHLLIKFKAKWDVVYHPNILNFIWFSKIARLGLIGKVGIMDSRYVRSKGGFKFLQLEITRLPIRKGDLNL